MSQKTFYRAAGVIFLLVFVVHLLRVLNGWTVAIDVFFVPMWWSWVLVVLTGILAYYGLKGR